ncbi:MAG: ABC transporter substrate-binding protein [Rhodococcus sp. (in: high G+C Gram-positive bacteria)]|uniref:ABC transporter substrate-binding protein n=1 Tax=Rhodococcus sp. TaxID=1831 RepID=UPI003BB6F6FE
MTLVLLSAFAAACANPSTTAENTRTITDRFGTVEVPAEPQRVLTLGWQEADTALALGVHPVGTAAFPFTSDGRVPWQAKLFEGDPAHIDTARSGASTIELDLEAIAALRPDLILATTFADLDTYRDQLTEIAPVVGPTSADYLTIPWQDQALQVGRALGREADTEILVDDASTRIDAAVTRHPELDGLTYTLGIATPAGYKAVNSPDDFSSVILGEFGMTLTDTVRSLPDTGDGSGAATLSPENVHQLDADVLLLSFFAVGGSGAALADPMFASIPAVADGRYIDVDAAALTALRNASALSIDYTISELIEAQIVPTASAHD